MLVLCHPPRNAGDENLQPRGGGSYVAEMDGNLTVTKDDMAVELHGKPNCADQTLPLSTSCCDQ